MLSYDLYNYIEYVDVCIRDSRQALTMMAILGTLQIARLSLKASKNANVRPC